MDRIQELLGRLADLSDAEVAELEGLILTEFDAAESDEPTSESVDRMVGLADALDTVRAEVEGRTERAAALAEKAKEAAARVRGDGNAETSMKDDEDEEEADVAEVADDIEQIAEDVAEAEEDVAEAEEDEEERKRREGYSEDTPAEAELSETTTETPDETPAQAELSDESPAEAEASAEDEAPAETEASRLGGRARRDRAGR